MTLDLSSLTEDQLEDYAAGKLRLTTKRTGEHNLVAAQPRGNSTSLKRRAYYRTWYLQNRAKRLAYMSKQRLKNKGEVTVPTTVTEVEVVPAPILVPEITAPQTDQLKQDRAEYFKAYRARKRIEKLAEKEGKRERRLRMMREWRERNRDHVRAYAEAAHAQRLGVNVELPSLLTKPAKPAIKPVEAGAELARIKKNEYQRRYRANLRTQGLTQDGKPRSSSPSVPYYVGKDLQSASERKRAKRLAQKREYQRRRRAVMYTQGLTSNGIPRKNHTLPPRDHIYQLANPVPVAHKPTRNLIQRIAGALFGI
jgi:hypothetical protein